MSGFPINLDLSEYFDDLRKYSSVYVNLSKFKDVGDVENHIKSVFGLEDNICLVNKKFLIPKSEDIQILQQYEIFKVQKCNFYDLQIHKTKKTSPITACDQKALNLTQSEKTIDLSCRPKQRLKANICPSPGISGTLTLPVNNNSKHLDSQVLSSSRATTIDGNQNISKERQKHKKKRHLQNDETDDDAGTDGNILDMTVKNSKRKKHSNCFSTDDGSFIGDSVNDSNLKDITKDSHKKSKKRKKHSGNLDNDSVNLVSTCWNSLVYDNSGGQSKKKSKKYREDCLNGGSSTNTNNSLGSNKVEDPFGQCDIYCPDECPSRKKHKHNRKYRESKELCEVQENQYYSSTPKCTFKNHSPKKSSSSKKYCDKGEENSNSNKHLEQQKNKMQVKIDEMISQIHKNNSDTSSQTNGDEEESVISSVKQPRSDSTCQEEGSLLEENRNKESCSEFDSTNPKRKRRRRCRRDKKKKEILMYMSAVGPVLNQLTVSPDHKTFPMTESAKHVFFSEEDFAEGKNIPATPNIRSLTQDSSEPISGHAEVVTAQQESSSKPVTWQDQLLKLASGSKPVVFCRNAAVSTPSKQVSSNHPTQEHSKPDSSAEKPLSPNRTDHNGSDVQDRESNHVEDFRRCNGDVKTDNNIEEQNNCCSGSVSGSSPRKGLPDICKPLPIPNDLHNVNISDYPIIDKVVAEDLILFKVLKLNENSEPGVSKPILARVNGTSDFPDRISLQILEGSEECSECTLREGSSEAFTLELRWSDILEPRLFYP